MKHKLIYAVLAIFVLAACTKSAEDTGGLDLKDERTPILFGSNLNNAATKAGVDAWTNAEDLYILGIDKTAGSYAKSEFYVVNVKAESPDTNPSGEITVKNPDSDEPFYYEENVNYDFFGYYVDDANDNPSDSLTGLQYSADSVSIALKIDGSQDIMRGEAHPDWDRITDGGEVLNTEYIYSAYAARRGVDPNIVFEHLLTRFAFHVVAGRSDDVDSIQINTLGISKADGSNLEDKAMFNVIGGTEYLVGKNSSGVKSFALKFEDGTSPNSANPLIGKKSIGGNPAKLGESIMMFPTSDSLKVTLNMTQGGITEPFDYSEVLRPGELLTQDSVAIDSFEPGKKYDITFVIWGREKIKVYAELAAWDSVKVATFDPDVKEDGIDSTIVVVADAEETDTVYLVYNDEGFAAPIDFTGCAITGKRGESLEAGDYTITYKGITYDITVGEESTIIACTVNS